MDCAEVREEIGACVIGALEPPAALAVEEHLASCASCRAEAVAYESASIALALSLPARRAPRDLRERVLATARAQPLRPRRWRWLGATAAAAAAVAFAATLAWAVSLQLQLNGVEEEQRRIDAEHDATGAELEAFAGTDPRLDAHEEAIYLLFEGDARRLVLAGEGQAPDAEALYLWSPGERSGVLLCHGLTEPPAGMTYQLWFRTDAGDLDGGTFVPDGDGLAYLSVRREAAPEGEPAPVRAVVVTLEPEGGAALAGGPVVLRSVPPQ